MRAQRVIGEWELRAMLGLPADVKIDFTRAFPETRGISIHLSGEGLEKFFSDEIQRAEAEEDTEATIIGPYFMPLKEVHRYGS